MAAHIPEPRCRVAWIKQTTAEFLLPPASVDLICAFSVFTHLEHEDVYRYLREAARIVRPDGRFVFSCLPMDTELARRVFLKSAANDFHARWQKVRDVTTTSEFMTTVAGLAGWTPVRWYAGDKPSIRLPDSAAYQALGQSVCVLVKAACGPGTEHADNARPVP